MPSNRLRLTSRLDVATDFSSSALPRQPIGAASGQIAHAALALAVFLVWLTGINLARADDYVWVEGENPTRHSLTRHGWYNNVVRESLSGGDWLSHFSEGVPPEAEYQFYIETSGRYFFWMRANSVAGARLSFQLDGAAWTKVDLGSAVENVNIATDGKPDMRFISWINAGQLSMKQGSHRVRFKFHSANNNHGGLDCFVLSLRPFMPRGSLRPGARTGRADSGFFAWEPDVDGFRDDAVIDLRYLNEDIAGQDGPVIARGNDFVLGSGQKVKFWGANVGPGIVELDHSSHVYLARNLAKRGVNLVRIHGGIYGQRDPSVNKKRLDDLHHLAGALKQEGIYVKLSFYFPLWFHLDGELRPFMLLFFDRQMQDLYFQWARALLSTSNPYTGIPLSQDPGVAIVEVINEDSHFFWTFGKKNMPAHRWEEFTTMFGTWLTEKYGSLEGAPDTWNGVHESGDRPELGRIDLYDAWFMTADGVKANPDKQKRIGDQVQFLTENMRGFYQRAADTFREDCGYKGLVSCSNWHTADASMLDALERYCYTAGDVIDHHGYYDHGHKGDSASWSVRPGQTFQSQSALLLSSANPLPFVETDGYPHIVSEIGWPMPNAYRAEGAFLTAAYGSLQGLDGIMQFAVGSPGWDQTVNKFPLNIPTALGSYFAMALAYREGYIQESRAVVVDSLRLEDLYSMQGSNVFVGPALDQLRASQIPKGTRKQGRIEAIDPLTFYVGRVVRNFKGLPEKSMHESTHDFINRETKTIRSTTGELAWDYGQGLATINTPKTQGVAGFLGKKGPVQLKDVRVDMKNEYGTVMVVSLDDRPLAESEKILIQCMTVDQPYGWKSSERNGKGGTIHDVGSAPWGVERIEADVSLRWNGPSPRMTIACDENGYPTERSVETRRSGAALTVPIDKMTAYTVIVR